ncbi:MAG: ATP synthase F1 subunit delta [Nitrospirae bacterium]|nr:ATP synthase F1 subunit delta [Nitrospirota bacterium]
MKISGKLAVRYAKSLYASVSIDKLEAVIDELSAVDRLVCEKKHMTVIFISPFFSCEDKMKALEVIAGKLSLMDITKRFIGTLTKSRAIKGLSQIITILTALYRDGMKTANAVVSSPIALTKEQTAELKKALSLRLNRDVTIENIIDPALIGGLIAKVGNLVIDNSIKGQLRLLTEALTKE